MHKRIILVGKAASGKDHMRKVLERQGFKYAISYTTRPPREGELDGKDYFFLSNAEAAEKVATDFFYEYAMFNDWLYGTSKKQFYKDDVFIMTPSGLSHVLPEDRKNSLVIFLDIPIEVRRERLSKRFMPGDSLERRIEADEKDFANFTDFDIKITDPNF